MPLHQTTPAGPAVQVIVELASSPQITTTTVASIAAGGQATLDSSQIPSGMTGKLLEVIIAASIPFKAVLQTVLNGVATTRVVWFSQVGGWYWRTSAKNLITVAESATAGFDGFRVVITNQDPTESADVYCTFLYDVEST